MAMFNKGNQAQSGADEAPQAPVTAQQMSSTPMAAADSSLSTIAQDMKITGDITCTGVIRIEGQVEGSIKGARQVVVGRQGTVKGDVAAKEAVIGGKIEGSVSASERVEVQSSALISGDIFAKSMLVQEGARINGAIRMEDPTAAQRGRETPAVTQSGPVAVVR